MFYVQKCETEQKTAKNYNYDSRDYKDRKIIFFVVVSKKERDMYTIIIKLFESVELA